uniref:Uncharacterized protein n=1 Tax=Tanacetum cinerariifolium TaxID=118510 RepID=A0A6L2KHL3_TANCI|nr:hypothetical protein [Tanacetum cinerariifolium]
MEYVKNSIDKRALHKREYDNRVNERQMQTTEKKVDTRKALDASLVNTKSSGIQSGKHDTSKSLGNDVDVDDVEIKPVYDEEPMAEENKTLKRHYKELSNSIKTTRAKTIEHTTSMIAQNEKFKAQLQEKGFAIVALKNELRKLTENSVNTKFSKSSILRKSVLQSLRNQTVVRQPTAFKSERPRISKSRFASQIDVNNDLPKPVTTYYLPRERESAFAKPHHMIAPSLSSSQLRIHDHINESSSSNLVSKVVPPADKTATSQQELELLFSPIFIPAESDSLPHVHAQTTKTYYKQQDSRIKKAQELKTKTSANSDIKDNSSETKLRGRLLESFQEDTKYEHVGQDTRSQGGKDD